MRIGRVLAAASAAMVLAGCGAAGEASRDRITAVGSSTVYPFTTAIAELFPRKYPDFNAPVVESNGTGGGIKLFCGGVGARFPDIADASRRMKKSEYDGCAENGVTKIIELQIGIDGIALAENVSGPRFALTQAQIYRALARTPFGKPQKARRWSDIDPGLPAVQIQVYGPPTSSGTRDALAELILTAGCNTDPAMKALKDTDEKRHAAICTGLREDGGYVEAGENDNLIAQKLAANPNALGVFGYSFLEENADRLRGVPLSGVRPSYDSIASYQYPGARPLYIYVKAAHLAAVPGLDRFVREYAASWNPGGYLDRRGLIAAPDAVRAANLATARSLTPLDPDTLK